MTIDNHNYSIPGRLKINLFTPTPGGVNWFWLRRARTNVLGSSLPLGPG